MAKDPITGIAGAIAKGLSLWETYLRTKAERYDLHLKKKRQHALNIAEDAFDVVREILEWISQKVELSDKNQKEFKKLITKYYKYNKKFNKFD